MAITLKYFAQKSPDGYPIPSTMMGFKETPKSASDLVEILPQNYEALPGQSVKKPDSGLRYFVRHKPNGDILPNSLMATVDKPEGRVYEFKLILGVGIVAPEGFSYTGLPSELEAGEAITPYSPSFTTAPTGTVVYTQLGLPDGLTINEATGVISGTPTGISGPASAVITVENEAGFAHYEWEALTVVDVNP